MGRKHGKSSKTRHSTPYFSISSSPIDISFSVGVYCFVLSAWLLTFSARSSYSSHHPHNSAESPNPHSPHHHDSASSSSANVSPSRMPSAPPTGTSYDSTSYQYTAFTPQVIHQHNSTQVSLHQSPEYIQTLQQNHTNHVSKGVATLNLHLSPYMHTRLVHNQAGMLPMDRLEVPFDATYQCHSPFQPPNLSHNSTSYQTMPQGNQDSTSSLQLDANSEYEYENASDNTRSLLCRDPQQGWCIQTNPANHVAGGDFTAVGTQFEGCSDLGYADTVAIQDVDA